MAENQAAISELDQVAKSDKSKDAQVPFEIWRE